jgi:hypothetical protein
MSEEEILEELNKNPKFDEEQGRSLLQQVEARGYNPPKRERVLDWMQRQKFPICPDTEDPGQCNVYRNLEFPKEIYDRISEFYQGNSN